uniref:G-protein coupled receptors family 1 profile domain-containing protein n=1 Tax=Poecilia formosa TaxID=48698 RepID=A0A096LZ41_POEFO
TNTEIMNHKKLPNNLVNPITASGYDCYIAHPTRFIFITFTVTQVALLSPLCASILYLGLQQLQQSHSDCFTYHMVVMELIGVFGCIVSFTGVCMKHLEILKAGLQVFWFTWYGQISFHTLTCVQRYLAVVHPVTYRCLRKGRGIRIRNICIGCIWMLCFGGAGGVNTGKYVYLDSSLMALSSVIVLFCSVSVLCVLVRPGPGGPGSERADQSKRKAFCTILVILGILMFRFCFGLVWVFFDISGNAAECMLLTCGICINIPSSLVLPLLFLQRRGKLWCCKSIYKLCCDSSD